MEVLIPEGDRLLIKIDMLFKFNTLKFNSKINNYRSSSFHDTTYSNDLMTSAT